MYLRTIQIVSEKDNIIRARCFFITRLYEEYLGKFNLDGSGMLSIIINDDNAPSYKYYDCDNVSIYHLSAEISETIKSVGDDMMCDTLNKIMYDVLYDIISKTKMGEERSIAESTLLDVYNAIRKSGYRFEKEIKKLSKLSNNKKYISVVCMRIGQDIGEQWELSIINHKTKKILISGIINEHGNSIDRRDMYHHCLWTEDAFCIYNRLNRLVYKIQIPVQS